MTAAMFDKMTGQGKQEVHCPALLRRGTLVHLWAPGSTPWSGDRPILARVEKATTDNIVGIDLRDGTRAIYDVSRDRTNPTAARWSWEVAAPPQFAASVDGVERIPGDRLCLEERIRLICGEPGMSVRFGMRDGGSVSGVLTTVIQDDPDAREASWCALSGPVDHRGTIVHWVRVPDIVSVTRTDA
jgi:hypothetical protein